MNIRKLVFFIEMHASHGFFHREEKNEHDRSNHITMVGLKGKIHVCLPKNGDIPFIEGCEILNDDIKRNKAIRKALVFSMLVEFSRVQPDVDTIKVRPIVCEQEHITQEELIQNYLNISECLKDNNYSVRLDVVKEE